MADVNSPHIAVPRRATLTRAFLIIREPLPFVLDKFEHLIWTLGPVLSSPTRPKLERVRDGTGEQKQLGVYKRRLHRDRTCKARKNSRHSDLWKTHANNQGLKEFDCCYGFNIRTLHCVQIRKLSSTFHTTIKLPTCYGPF